MSHPLRNDCRGHFARLSILLLILAGITACRTQGDSPTLSSTSLVFATQPPNEEGEQMEALLEGQLIDQDHCLRVLTEDNVGNYLLVFPQGYRLETEQEPITILNNEGQPVGRIGDHVSITGGEVPDTMAEQLTWHPDGATPCSGPYWFVGTLLP